MTLPQLSDLLPPLHVRVDFGSGVPLSSQGRALLMLEKYLRIDCGVPAEVFKATMPDDLKRRRDLTDEDRKRL